MAKQRNVIFWSLGATGVVILVSRSVKGEWPDVRTFLALGIMYVILGFAYDFAPKLAGPFALLIFFAVLMYQGVDAFGGISSLYYDKKRRRQIRPVKKKGGKAIER